MRKFMAFSVVFVLMMSFARCGWAADEPKPSDKPAPTKPAPGPGAAPGQPGGGGGDGGGFGRGGGFGGGFGGPGGGFGGPGMLLRGAVRDPIDELIAVLGELNLSPDFTLTADQKTKIKSVRDDFKKQQDAWRDEHADEIKKLQDQAAELRGGGGPGGGGGGNREKFQEIFQARQELMASAPKSDDAIVEIKGILTTEQLKQVDTAVAARQAEMEKMREEMRGRFGPGGGGQRGGGQGGPGGRGAGRGGAGGGGGAGRGGAGGAPRGI